MELVDHTLISEHQLDTMYRVGVEKYELKKYEFTSQLDTMYRFGVHSELLHPNLIHCIKLSCKTILFYCIVCLITKIWLSNKAKL